jgi:hypothetical protein
MPTASRTARRTKGGRRLYVVRFCLGGRAYPVEHGGSFSTLREARIRRDLIAGELAAGRNPRELLRTLTEQPTVKTFEQVFEDFISSRVDVAPATLENYKMARDRFVPIHGASDPLRLSWQDVQEAVGTLSQDLSPASVRVYVGTLRQELDFAGADPNPAKDRRVKLGRSEATIPDPPTEREQWPRSSPTLRQVAPCSPRSRTNRDTGWRALQARMGRRGPSGVALPRPPRKDGGGEALGCRSRLAP